MADIHTAVVLLVVVTAVYKKSLHHVVFLHDNKKRLTTARFYTVMMFNDVSVIWALERVHSVSVRVH